MERLLTPMITSYKSKGQESADFLVEVPRASKPSKTPTAPRTSRASTPAEALEILRNEPDFETLISTLRYLVSESSGISITSPSPIAAQLVHVLVSETVPTYWSILQPSQNGKSTIRKSGRSNNSKNLELLLSCLKSVTGLNAILLSLKQFIQKSKESKKEKVIGGSNPQDILSILLELLSALLEGRETVQVVYKTTLSTSEPSKQKAIWNEFTSIVAGGKILGITAEAEDTINELRNGVGEKSWISDGAQYSKWLASNISHWASTLQVGDETAWARCADLLSKSFRLGYTQNIIRELVTALVLQNNAFVSQFDKLLSDLQLFDQKTFILSILQLISTDYLSSIVTSEADTNWWREDATVVSAAAGILSLILSKEESRKSLAITWATGSSGAGAGEGIAIRRAVLAALAEDKSDLETILEKSLLQFGDQLYIRHTPTMQQEVHAQVLLLAAGYVHRKSPLRLSMMMRSGTHLSVVSNRLGASSARARFLGMVVGEALSSLVDKGDKIMDFKQDETKSSEGKWYKSLVGVSDTIGSLDPLMSKEIFTIPKKKPPPSKPVQPKKPMIPEHGSRIVAIEEIEGDSEEEESDNDGLVPYAKPDSDAEDSDEDATLIIRNKPTAPVYIRDLITYLRDTDNYDRQKLGLQTATPLIRRKATFGTEVSTHAEELATLLVGLQDKYGIDDFQEMRQQGMIAILISQPLKMGQWFSKTFFDGDYSISQRATVLTTLGLGARELGGYSNDSSASTRTPIAPPPPSFPSKSLPQKMHALYSPPTPPPLTAVDHLSTQLTNTMIAPMAASLADSLTGPSILKVRTFSSRMAVEKARKKPIANALAKVVSDGFFFPLTGRAFIHLRSSHSSSPLSSPYLLTLLLKTLSLLLHASGPSTISLPVMTAEFWDLLLGVRGRAVGDVSVVEAILMGLLTILEVHEEKRGLVEGFGRQLLETQEWVEEVFGRLGAGVGGVSEEDERVRMLAAAVLVKVREVVGRYQALLMGDLATFQS